MMMRWFILFVFLLTGMAVASGQTRTGKDRALLFAVNDYREMTDLKNPIQNARDIAAELERRYGFVAEVVPNPSFEKIETKIQEYQRAYRSGKYPSDGQLFIFFSGHGVMGGNNGYFMPADADPERPYATAMDYNYWRSEINAIDCQHILVAVDACHSIAFDPNWEKKPDRKFARPGEQHADQTLLNHEQYRARLFFTSDAIGDQTPDRSTFARQLLEGLRTYQAAVGYLTSSELFANFLLKAVPTPGGGDFGSDEPGSCFLFFQKGNGTDPEEERFWQLAMEMNTKEAYGFYLQRYPDGKYAADAENRRKPLGDSSTPPVAPARPPDNMVFIQGGSFEMGDTFGGGSDDEKPIHTVTVSDFYLSIHETTFDEYDAFCDATGREKPDDKGWGRGRRPVIYVSWNDAVEYCNWRSRQEQLQEVYTISGKNVTANWNANGYRLPTEAEWEFAARQRDQKVRFGNGENTADPKNINFDGSANYKKAGVYRKETVPVGSLSRPNSLGLHDISGNVWEWCWDWYDSGYYEISNNSRDPKGPDSGSGRVLRGGSWYSFPTLVRVAVRFNNTPGSRVSDIGFRLARPVE
ncbi:MAG: SUMF1/EgtB/PvdO family nonheme iron enzyme [Phaeodactylibacter sp.]|nr:SUMF1/EgtB/PvdO family nonheme iron enzyme [Phaeodactylibacter sp.]